MVFGCMGMGEVVIDFMLLNIIDMFVILKFRE